MFTVQGYIDRIPYTVTVDPDILTIFDAPEVTSTEIISGSNNAVSLLLARVGKDVSVTPTGPVVTVALNDPTAILGALQGLTDVSTVTGNAPNLFPSDPNVVY